MLSFHFEILAILPQSLTYVQPQPATWDAEYKRLEEWADRADDNDTNLSQSMVAKLDDGHGADVIG